MKRSARIVAAAALAAATTPALGGLSHWPFADADGQASLVRLSWRYRGEREEQCRELSQEDLARLPAHLRQPVVCAGQTVSFLLEVRIDGTTGARDTIRSAGAHADRPLYVFREFRVRPGDHTLRVSFRSLGRNGESSEYQDQRPGERERRERSGERAESARRSSAQVSLELEARIELAPGEVVLVTLDADGSRLVLRRRCAS